MDSNVEIAAPLVGDIGSCLELMDEEMEQTGINHLMTGWE